MTNLVQKSPIVDRMRNRLLRKMAKVDFEFCLLLDSFGFFKGVEKRPKRAKKGVFLGIIATFAKITPLNFLLY